MDWLVMTNESWTDWLFRVRLVSWVPTNGKATATSEEKKQKQKSELKVHRLYSSWLFFSLMIQFDYYAFKFYLSLWNAKLNN